ncbi:F-type H+-transporting ATPase subunit alpha [Lachnospiraceae bacterium XPB1003]|nr:F-type H+-transporting ATPase subunit alpha [Lachnospiraceae bacterium XPB1003]
MEESKKAFIYSATEPDDRQRARFEAFLTDKYNSPYELVWEKDESVGSGFRLKAGGDVYDWTEEGRFRQLADMLDTLDGKDFGGAGDVISLFKTSINEWQAHVVPEEEGTVLTVGDGIVVAEGLEDAVYGEIVIFESGVKGMVQDLRPDSVGIILFGDDTDVTEGCHIRRTKKTAGIPVGEAYLGRVVNALGEPIDAQGRIKADEFRAIESPAPDIVSRQPVDTPMNTGLITIDSMFPIGRGQRELIIGDRQTGKTTIAMDTILNQKGNGVICIYVAIGQKSSSVAHLVENLRKKGAMDYTIVVSASASETAPVQYIAPYAGASLGEYFMNKGKDVLIIYDDLSKHAIAYRALSLLLERSPGREAYPGDVFYLHSRLLERSARLSDAMGGGSMTALPIVETQAGDVSAYIPTNIISITDGQIFLESDLFFAGQRPAVNVGLSVSRVGGAAQTKAMKKAVGSLRLDLAQYREMEVFTQFSSDLDETTKKQLHYGQGLMKLLIQQQGHPLALHEQVIILVSAIARVMEGLEVSEVITFRDALVAHFNEQQSELCDRIDETGIMEPEDKELIIAEAKKFLAGYMNKK